MDLKLIYKLNLDISKCKICAESKQPRTLIKSVERNTSILELIHSDVYDSTKILTCGSKRYIVTFIDNYSRYYYCYLIKSKDKTFSKFKVYKSKVENQKEKKIKILRFNRGGEYTLNKFFRFYQEHGIIYQVTTPYSPQSNDILSVKIIPS